MTDLTVISSTTIDAATFTSIRLLSGALMLTLLTLARGRSLRGEGNWLAAAALFAYAAAFFPGRSVAVDFIGAATFVTELDELVTNVVACERARLRVFHARGNG